MKKFIIIIICLHFNLIGFAQLLNGIDEISQFHDGIAAVKKGNQWSFINENGETIIPYRQDLVLTKMLDKDQNVTSYYPVFMDGRCLIKKLINDIYYYGYIDIKGNEIIHPQYLNATNFKDGYAIVIAPSKDVIGYNEVLKKEVISSNIEEFVIDITGKKVRYLENPIDYHVTKRKSKNPPVFRSKFVAPHRVAVQKKHDKWDLYEF